MLQEARELAKQEPAMRAALFGEALEAFFLNDFALVKHLLRLLIHCTIGFEPLSKQLGFTSKSLMRMLSNNGNPTTKNLLQILNAIRRHQQIDLKLYVTALDLQDLPYVVNILSNHSHTTHSILEKTS